MPDGFKASNASDLYLEEAGQEPKLSVARLADRRHFSSAPQLEAYDGNCPMPSSTGQRLEGQWLLALIHYQWGPAIDNYLGQTFFKYGGHLH